MLHRNLRILAYLKSLFQSMIKLNEGAMTKYSIGQRVSLISYSGKKGRIESYVSSEGGYNYYEVLWDDCSLEVISDSFIKPEIKINTPWDLIANNEFFDYRDFSIAVNKIKILHFQGPYFYNVKDSFSIQS